MIIIDADKILNIAGKRTFPVGIYDICNANWERIGLTGPCTPSNNKEFLFGVEEIIYDTATYKALYENAGVYYTLYGPYVENNMPWDLINGPQFFGYYQEDEPPITDLTIVSNTYNNIKLQDPNHPVILNHGGDMTTWYPYCDVITWDSYPFCDDSRYPREDSIYAYESNSNDYFFKGSDINSINKPVWAVIQANGVFLPVTWIYGGTGFYVLTPAEVRSNTYAAITMDVKGIVYWGYELLPEPLVPNGTAGLYANPTLHTYYKRLAAELRSFNDWLISPTIDYSWAYHPGNNSVTFSPVLTKIVIGIQFNTNFNFILKRYNNSYYLIVVNKDSSAISNVTIVVTGLTGSMTATTLGIETQGSGRSGRVLSVNNGKFNDNFDGSVVHIYKIGTTAPVNSIQISPTSANVNIGKTIKLIAICRDQSGKGIICPTLIWKSSNTSVATVNSNGLVRGITKGTANIIASSGTIISNVSIVTVKKSIHIL